MNFASLISTSLSLFLLIAIGFFLRKIGIVDETFTKKLSGFVAKAAQPFLIAYSIIKLDYSAENLKNGFIVLGFGVLAHLFMALVALLAFFRIGDADEKKIHQYACTFSNCAFVGYPILNALFGELGLFYGAFYVIVYNLGVWSYGVALMARGKGVKISLRKMLLNLGTIPCAIGLGIYIARIPLPDFLLSLMDNMAGLCTPLSLIVTGSLVAAMPLRRLFTNPKLYYFCAVKLLVLPLAAALILRFLGISDLIADVNLAVFLTVMIALPPAAFTSLFADMYDVKPSYAAQLVSLGTMLSPFTILLVMKITELIL